MAFNGRFVLNIIHFAAQQGADLKELIALTGLSPADMQQESCRLESEAYNRVVERAEAATGNPLLGMHAGESLNLAAAGLIVQITQTSATVRQALDYCCEFANLGCSSLPLSLAETGDHFRVNLTPNRIWAQQSSVAVRHTAEGSLAFTIREFQSLTRHRHAPIAVHLPWQPAGPIAEYERVMGCPVRFGQEHIALLLDRAQVEAPIMTSDYDLLRVLVHHAEAKNAALEAEAGFASRLRQSILRMMTPGFPTVEQVAHHLHTSPRTLQRRLKTEGLTYKQLIDDLRREFALAYLRRPDLSVGQIAELLDYADSSTFSRSFKRWTGHSPLEFRQIS